IENATESRTALQSEYEESIVVQSNLKIKLDDFVDRIGNEEERSALEKEYQEAQSKSKSLHNRIESLGSVLNVLEKRKANYENVLENLNSLQALDKNNYKLVLDQYNFNMSSLENLNTNGSMTDDKDFYADLYAYQMSQAWSSSKVSHKKFEWYSEGEWIFDLDNQEDNYTYFWSDLSYYIKDWWWSGISLQRLRLYQSSFESQRGLLNGFSYKNAYLVTYFYNPFSSDFYTVLSVGINF
ncbi:MAG: hypothetical protein MUE71_10340, partial [Chitinophagaceae bacterium]|nr:hypothetical protein [Chitinophagaceae bacterium]